MTKQRRGKGRGNVQTPRDEPATSTPSPRDQNPPPLFSSLSLSQTGPASNATRRRGGGASGGHVAPHLPGARLPARPRLLLLLFSPLQLDSAARCAPRGFCGGDPGGLWQAVGGGCGRGRDADKVSSNVAAVGPLPSLPLPPACPRTQRGPGWRVAVTRPEAPLASRLRPVPCAGAWLILPSPAVLPRLAVTLPIVPKKQNGDVSGEGPVRAHPSSPLRGP